VADPEPGSREHCKEQGGAASFPVVGVGASAGGLEAFRELLKHLPADTGMAFVLVQHLDPHHESLLASLQAGSTAMAVREARDNMPVEPNCVYVIPPDTNMGILHERLQLVQRQMKKGRYLPVEWFLRTLAECSRGFSIRHCKAGTRSMRARTRAWPSTARRCATPSMSKAARPAYPQRTRT